ncbi:hypothetical protein FB008_12178 [Sinorhizobium medicae]|uniref:Sugar kinase YdjH n=1 Tax=Sinorhizobium medicae TaxID=110321 RepID=A0A508X280_9HYPH
MPALEVDVVCTCGWGDASNAGFAAGIIDVRIRMRRPGWAASSALNATGLGSQAGGIVRLENTLAFLEGAPVKRPQAP